MVSIHHGAGTFGYWRRNSVFDFHLGQQIYRTLAGAKRLAARNFKENRSSGMRITRITIILLTIFSQATVGQSVYVGKAGSRGKVLRAFVDPSALKKLTEQPVDSIWIIDVRSETAYEKGHIPTARSFPSGTILHRLTGIPKEKYLILYCTVGGLAEITAHQLKKSGYKRYMVWGGINRWKWERTSGPDR
jgi:rhodanese-related sulfurtransferase